MSRVKECDGETLQVWPLFVVHTDPDPPSRPAADWEWGMEGKRAPVPRTQ